MKPPTQQGKDHEKENEQRKEEEKEPLWYDGADWGATTLPFPYRSARTQRLGFIFFGSSNFLVDNIHRSGLSSPRRFPISERDFELIEIAMPMVRESSIYKLSLLTGSRIKSGRDSF